MLKKFYQQVDSASTQHSLRHELIVVDGHTHREAWKIPYQKFGLWDGLQHFDGLVVVVLDTDRQDRQEIQPDGLQKWIGCYGAARAARCKRKEGPLKRVTCRAYHRSLRLLAETDVPLDFGGICVRDCWVPETLTGISEQQPFVPGLLAWIGDRQVSVIHRHYERAAGDRTYTLAALVKLGLDGIVSASIRPLRTAIYGASHCLTYRVLAGNPQHLRGFVERVETH